MRTIFSAYFLWIMIICFAWVQWSSCQGFVFDHSNHSRLRLPVVDHDLAVWPPQQTIWICNDGVLKFGSRLIEPRLINKDDIGNAINASRQQLFARHDPTWKDSVWLIADRDTSYGIIEDALDQIRLFRSPCRVYFVGDRRPAPVPARN